MSKPLKTLKKTPELIASFEERCFFEDEMHSGTRSECKRRWREKGRRPLYKMKLGYEYCYLYAALQPFEGRLISLILPDMTKESFKLFIDHFTAETQDLYGKENKVLLIADRAGSHQADVIKDSNIIFKKLPALLLNSIRQSAFLRSCVKI